MRDWDALRRDVKPIYTAVNAAAANDALDQFAETWGQPLRRYHPAVAQRQGRVHPVPGLRPGDRDRAVQHERESLNARYRRAVR